MIKAFRRIPVNSFGRCTWRLSESVPVSLLPVWAFHLPLCPDCSKGIVAFARKCLCACPSFKVVTVSDGRLQRTASVQVAMLGPDQTLYLGAEDGYVRAFSSEPDLHILSREKWALDLGAGARYLILDEPGTLFARTPDELVAIGD